MEGEPVPSLQYQASKNTKPFAGSYPDSIIIHYTAGRDAESSASYLIKPDVQASAHVVIGRDGKIYQLIPFNMISWHAGVSNYAGRKGWNEYSIGIELDNAGPLTKTGNQFISWFGRTYPEHEVLFATHRNENQSRYWHTFSEVQIEACQQLCECLIGHYPIKSILGHEEISAGRKTDPGPAFPLDKLRETLMSHNRKDAEVDIPTEGTVIPDKLNIRAGAGDGHPMVAKPLKEGQPVKILDKVNGWYKVKAEIEGWVSASFIKS